MVMLPLFIEEVRVWGETVLVDQALHLVCPLLNLD
jgi:hypothetical protein